MPVAANSFATRASVSLGPNRYLLGLDIDSATHRLYVSDYYSNMIWVIDTTTNTPLHTMWMLQGYPYRLAVDPATGRLYASNLTGLVDVFQDIDNGCAMYRG